MQVPLVLREVLVVDVELWLNRHGAAWPGQAGVAQHPVDLDRAHRRVCRQLAHQRFKLGPVEPVRQPQQVGAERERADVARGRYRPAGVGLGADDASAVGAAGGGVNRLQLERAVGAGVAVPHYQARTVLGGGGGPGCGAGFQGRAGVGGR